MTLHKLPFFNVSRETSSKLEIYQELLIKWQKAVNLVAPPTLIDANIRHFEDSYQIGGLLRDEIIVDIGSGAGFPGLVLAAFGYTVNLVEVDQKKCQFLKNVSREASIPVTIHNDRVENVDIPNASLVTARALASLDKLIEMTEKWWLINPAMRMIFLKGAKADEEIAAAKLKFDFDVQVYQSKTDKNGRILLLTNVRRIP